jgi:hypothetical protein
MAFTTWNYLSSMSLMEKAHKRVPGAPALGNIHAASLEKIGPWDDPEFVRQKLSDVGCKDIKVEMLDFTVPADTARVYTQHFRVMLGGMFLYAWTAEEKAKYEPLLLQEIEKVLAEESGGPDEVCQTRFISVIATAVKPSSEDI